MASTEALIAVEDQDPRQKGNATRALVLSTVAGVGAFMFGWTLGFSGPALEPMENANNNSHIASPFKCNAYKTSASDQNQTSYGTCDTSDEGDFFGAITNIGCMIGALLGGVLSDRLGRKRALQIASMPFIAGWVWMASTSSVAQVDAARVLTGIAVGVVSVNVPVYIAEVAPPHLRGALGCINQLAITIGIFFVYLVGLAMQEDAYLDTSESNPTGDASFDPSQVQVQKFARWDWLAYLGAIITGIFLVLMTVVAPETPKWLAINSRANEARAVLERLRGDNYDVQSEMDDLVKSDDDAVGDVSLSDLTTPEMKRPMFIGCSMMVLQQFTGINAVIFYSTEIFDGANVNGTTGSVIVMGTQVVITGIACLLVDRLGRKVLLYIASSGMTLSSLLMALFYHINGPNSLAILAMVCYIIFFSLGMGAIPWLLMSEIFPARLRGLAGSVATCVNWTCSFILTMFFSKMKGTMGPAGVFLFFAIECVCTGLFVKTCVPETKGKTLEEIEAEFKKQR